MIGGTIVGGALYVWWGYPPEWGAAGRGSDTATPKKFETATFFQKTIFIKIPARK